MKNFKNKRILITAGPTWIAIDKVRMISNTATALIIIPIAVAAAGEIGISPRPVLMSVCIAAAASFLTPVATPVNLMVMGPAGYKFSDYWKLGLPCMIWFFVMAVFYVPLIWRF